MAKSILSSLLNTTVKVVDKSIKQAARERQRQAKAAQRERERTAKAAERERQAKAAGNQPTRSVEVDGSMYAAERVNINKFIKMYMSAIPEDVFNKLNKLQMQGVDFADLPVYVIDKIKANRAKQQAADNLLAMAAERNNLGIKYEKLGRIPDAIATYEQNIADGYPADHSFKRLVILYRKENDYIDEKRVILKAIEVFENNTFYEDRLSEVEQLINDKEI